VHPATFQHEPDRTGQAASIVAIIPARYHSSRLPGKPLADIAGRPMIEHVFSRTASLLGIDNVIVATDDRRIADAIEKIGGTARMTAGDHQTGTDRIAEVARELTCDIVLNVQGDLPLIEPGMIMELIQPLQADQGLAMSTLCRPAAPDDLPNPNVVKVVRNRTGDALYFSRSPIPYLRQNAGVPVMKHIGLYGYRRDFLMTFAALPQTPLERSESLEQLRALEYGYRIGTVETRYESIEVDTPDDLERVRRQMTTAAHT
jgi:3-deoxy-manno-octulosonate cytidylyltransferase (CMP-KDO synthetase)